MTDQRALVRQLRSTAIVVIGASLGGTTATQELLKALPPEFDIPIAIAQHRHPTSTETFARAIARGTRHLIIDAEDGMPIERGKVYLAPADYHLLVEKGICRLSVDDRVKYTRPSIDVLFESASDSYDGKVTAVVLTGANEDGAHGAKVIKRRGGTVLVQDPSTAEAPTMPNAAKPYADAILTVREIGELLGSAAQDAAAERQRDAAARGIRS